ncbi:hypothetical protein DdX_03304 [Ditylenchus destructor]|uniref:Uncharacterized protein n=1 Tax=Ditylenchus destructor TaxID=166010 RepID=A0AAD4NFL8_9BILA|nr:hypothetical protein DdX_03304 [Ditylenchus destructor]
MLRIKSMLQRATSESETHPAPCFPRIPHLNHHSSRQRPNVERLDLDQRPGTAPAVASVISSHPISHERRRASIWVTVAAPLDGPADDARFWSTQRDMSKFTRKVAGNLN